MSCVASVDVAHMSSEMQNQNAADMVLDLRIQLFAVNSSSSFPSSVVAVLLLNGKTHLLQLADMVYF